MSMESRIEFPGGEMVFSEKEEAAALVRVSGNPTSLEVPETLESGVKVTSVSKKAFLGRKSLKKLILPNTVTLLGDWCFAGCENLKEVSLPASEAGEGIFRGCVSLERINVSGAERSVCELLAGAVRNAAPNHLTDLRSLSDDWLAKWDAWALKIIGEPDDEGFTNQILCGEEDYGSSDRGAYESRRRVLKASLCILRLLNDDGLSGGTRQIFTDYLYRHRAGSEEGDESWKALKEVYPDRKHFDLLESLGCITDENRDLMIRDLGEEKPELKSLLMKTAGNDAMDNFFKGLEL